MLIGCLILFAVGVVLGTFLYRTLKRKKQLEAYRTELREENDRLKKELREHLNIKMTVILTLPERRIILNALESPQYKARVQDPKTKRFIRIIYNTLRKKIKESIKEA